MKCVVASYYDMVLVLCFRDMRVVIWRFVTIGWLSKGRFGWFSRGLWLVCTAFDGGFLL